ncbi:uncharacterized protein EV420DRAFT_1484416 [Desarmillaria tabescens]|uniref:Uncharacterized protein n=1 Tax=Armillaria tabescens TaxID=1929756 RepID=A0AA39JLJ0_ARMTA|nr:uncharacterized protein EV420DRAFT_1484416 [Desarmillaria tabescens]KAK0444981.1 hypothetical protein EV420DRAFT_1484416 [Desarmillaria tabescens]
MNKLTEQAQRQEANKFYVNLSEPKVVDERSVYEGIKDILSVLSVLTSSASMAEIMHPVAQKSKILPIPLPTNTYKPSRSDTRTHYFMADHRAQSQFLGYGDVCTLGNPTESSTMIMAAVTAACAGGARKGRKVRAGRRGQGVEKDQGENRQLGSHFRGWPVAVDWVIWATADIYGYSNLVAAIIFTIAYVHVVLSIFCAIRVAAFTIRAILIGSELAGENLGLFIGDEVLFGIGLYAD